MHNTIRCELFKLFRSKTFWITFAVMAVLGVVMIPYAVSSSRIYIEAGMEDQVNGVSDFLSCLSDFSLVMVIGAILAGNFICGDFENRLMQSGISAGSSRLILLLGKSAVYFLAVLIVSIPYPLISLIHMSIRYGFGTAVTISSVLKLLAIFIGSAITNMALLGFCILLSFWLQKSGVVIGVGIAVLLIGGSLLFSAADMSPTIAKIVEYTPFGLGQAITAAIDVTAWELIRVLVISFIYIAILLGTSYGIFRKAELK